LSNVKEYYKGYNKYYFLGAMDSVITIPALGDNFIYLYRYNQNDSLAVDPCDSSLVLRTLREHNLKLKTILITHHHWDHIAGIADLKRKTDCKIIGADKQRIPSIDSVVEDGQILPIGNRIVRVIATPGHTRTSVCYYMEPSAGNENGILWTGDTLFVGGCGRLLECDAQTMWESLQRLASLPDETLVYCGHDYTLENYEFASGIEPNNQAVKERLDQIRQSQTQGKLTVPSSILQERSTNCFLRAGTPEMKVVLAMPQAQAVDVFAELRRRKDIF
jgi:hydroxyacylglutathione hydrolase